MELRGTQYTGKYLHIAVNSNFLRWCRSIELNSDIHAVVSAKKKQLNTCSTEYQNVISSSDSAACAQMCCNAISLRAMHL